MTATAIVACYSLHCMAVGEAASTSAKTEPYCRPAHLVLLSSNAWAAACSRRGAAHKSSRRIGRGSPRSSWLRSIARPDFAWAWARSPALSLAQLCPCLVPAGLKLRNQLGQTDTPYARPRACQAGRVGTVAGADLNSPASVSVVTLTGTADGHHPQSGSVRGRPLKGAPRGFWHVFAAREARRRAASIWSCDSPRNRRLRFVQAQVRARLRPAWLASSSSSSGMASGAG
jgi:hypothetical protein